MPSPAAIPMIIGAGAGAMMDDEKPLRGAMLGGMGGAIAPQLMGAATASPGAYGALPGMAAPSAQTAMLAEQAAGLGAAAIPAGTQGAQAAMLAQQTADFGLPGMMATGEAAAAPGSLAGKAFGMGKNLGFGGGMGGDSAKMIQAGQSLQKGEERPQQVRMMGAAPQINPQQGGEIKSPHQRKREEEYMNSYAYGQPSLLPGFRR